MLPVPADRPLPSTPPWQLQIPNPTVDVPEYLLQLVPFVTPKLAAIAYNNQTAGSLSTFAHNLLASNNWANQNMKLATKLTLLYIMSVVGPGNIPPQHQLDNLAETGYQLYISYLVKLFPDLQGVVDQQTLAGVMQNIPVADGLLTNTTTQSVGTAAPLGQYGLQQPPASGRNLASSPMGQPQQPIHQQTVDVGPLLTNSFSDPLPVNTNTGSISDSGEKKPAVANGDVRCNNAPFMTGEDIPPMVHIWEERQLVAKGNRKYWRIVVKREDHQINPTKLRAKNPLEVGVRQLVEETDMKKEEALEKMVEESIVRDIRVTTLGYTEVQNILVGETYGIEGTTGFSVVDAIVLNTTVGRNKDDKLFYVPRDAKINGTIPKSVTSLALGIKRKLRDSDLIPVEELDAFLTYYNDLVNSKLYHSFGSEVYVETFDVDFSEMDEIYDELRSELPESVFAAFEEWDSEFLKSFKEIKKTGDNSVDNIVTPLTVVDYQRVVLPEAYTFIVVDMGVLGYDLDDIEAKIIKSGDPTASLRVDTRNASHLDAILNRVAEISPMHGAVVLVDASTAASFKVGVEFNHFEENWVLCKPVF